MTQKIKKKAINNIISLDSWKELKKVFRNEIERLTNNDNIKSSWSNKQIANQVRADKKAGKILLSFISKMEDLGTNFNKENESFK